MAADNPFVYGEIVPAAAFVGRDVELERLTTDLASGQKVFLISPRRYGKSSLVHQAARRWPPAHRDARVHRQQLQLVRRVSRRATRARSSVSRRGRRRRDRGWRRSSRRVTPEIRVERRRRRRRVARVPVHPHPRDAARLAEEVFALPARIAARLGRRLVIALDEFQAIAAFNGGSVEQALRAAVQQQRQVGYVFAGSEPTLMEQMIGPKRPFYKAGPVMRLQKIPGDVFADFLEERFRTSGLPADAGLGEAIVDLAGNLPYDVQRLAHETWDDAAVARRQSASGVDDLHATLHRLLTEQDTLFEAVWQRLTLAQRSTMRAVVLEHGVGLLAAETRTRHRLGGASSVQASLTALLREDLIVREDDGHYAVVDSLMSEWVARKTY